MNRELWIPVSIRKQIANAIKNANPEPSQTTLEWAQTEAACRAITPYILHLLDNPQSAVTKPTNNSNSL